MNTEHHLTITWSTSRGRDTYGYNVASLRENGKLMARCNGGGYDMRGTVFAMWLTQAYAERLVELEGRAAARFSKAGGYKSLPDTTTLYGLAWDEDRQRASIDGACGLDTVRNICEAVGLTLTMVDAGKNTDVIIVRDTREAAPAAAPPAPAVPAARPAREVAA